jgi:hypothetical protein
MQQDASIQYWEKKTLGAYSIVSKELDQDPDSIS